MRKLPYIILLSVFLLPFAVFAQQTQTEITRSRRELSKIDKMPLERAVFGYANASEDDDAYFPCFKDITENRSYQYRDKKNRIRKFITMLNHPETLGYAVHYFDKTGSNIYSSLFLKTCMSPHYYGYRILAKGEQIYCDMDSYDEELNRWIRITYANGATLSTGLNCFDNILHTDSIVPFCKLMNYTQETPIEKVIFTQPNAGQKTIINTRNVPIRELDDSNSNTIYTPIFGEIVEVIGKGKREKIKPYGENDWYKIRIENKIGFVCGAFLEPVDFTTE